MSNKLPKKRNDSELVIKINDGRVKIPIKNQFGETLGSMERLATAERKLADMQNRLNTSYSGIKSKLASYGTGLVSLKEKLFGVNSANNKTANSNSKLSKSFKDTSKSAGSARMSIGRMLTMSLLFSGVFRILSALTQGIIGGFNNLAQYSKTTNANISTLWGSLVRLQNAFATAFSPILTVITPILSRFIDLISTAITYVGMFFGYLAGNKTYTKALAVQKDYAASLDKTAKSTKKATKAAKDYLSPLDEINRYAYEGSDISISEMANLLQMIVNQRQVQLYYFSVYYGRWREAPFYVTQGSVHFWRIRWYRSESYVYGLPKHRKRLFRI